MRFLVDNSLSPLVAEGLRHAGHDVVLAAICEALECGSVIVIEQARIRIRALPIGA